MTTREFIALFWIAFLVIILLGLFGLFGQPCIEGCPLR
jgi:hypothetical protein